MTSSIPLQSVQNMEDPEEHFLWALVGLPGPGSQAPLILPPEILKRWSAHFYKCGFRHHPDLQQIKYVPPSGDMNWITGATGRWVPIDEELPAAVTAPGIDHLSLDEKRVLLERLQSEVGPLPEKETEDAALVTTVQPVGEASATAPVRDEEGEPRG